MEERKVEDQRLRPSIESLMGLRELNPVWAKTEIVLGLACVWLSLQSGLLRTLTNQSTSPLFSAGLFILGGYLAMAGSRSHLYQSANRLTEFLSRQIEDKA